MRRLLLFILVCSLPCFAGRRFNGTTEVITVPEQNITSANIDDSLTGWKPVCILPSCNPGGVGIPTATDQSINHPSPSLDGESMQVSITGPAFSNALWVFLAGPQDQALSQSFDVHIFLSANATVLGSAELDQFNFDRTNMIEFMYGSQCNFVSGFWEIWRQDTQHWIATSVACSLTFSAWHEISETVHRIPGDTGLCSGMPCQCYDNLTIDGVVHALNICEPAGPLDPTFASEVGFQTQLDIGSGGSAGVPVTENIDEATFTSDATATNLFTGSMTISLWMNPEVVGSTEHEPLAKYNNAVPAQQQYVIAIGSLGVGAAGQIGFVVGSFSAILGVYGACGTVTPGHWYNVILSVDSAGVYSGSPAATLQMTGFSTCSVTVAFRERRTSGGTNLLLGGITGSSNYSGTVAEVGIWNTVLSPAERATLASGVPPRKVRSTALVGYYPLYGAASQEPDLAGYHGTGILTGTTTGPQCPCSSP